MITKILRKTKQKLPETFPGPTQMFCVTFSPIGSVVLEKLKINVYFCAKKVDDRENIAKIETKVARDIPWTNTDVLCEFQLNLFSRFRET